MVEGHVLIAKIKVKCFHYLTSSVKKKNCSSHSPATSSKRESHPATSAETGVFFILALLEIFVVIMAK